MFKSNKESRLLFLMQMDLTSQESLNVVKSGSIRSFLLSDCLRVGTSV